MLRVKEVGRSMSTATARLPDVTIQTPDLYRMSVDQYEQMADLGVLDDPRVELIDGLLVRKMTKKPPHVWASDAVRSALAPLVPLGWYVREEKPVRIPEFDEPEPDLAIVRGTRDDYRTGHPGPENVGLIVEIAESSLARDRGEKLAAYGRGGVPEYWIINLVDRVVERYSQPRTGGVGYGSRLVVHPGETISVLLDGRELGQIAVAELLP
jgi:Uma2 family endonuclease